MAIGIGIFPSNNADKIIHIHIKIRLCSSKRSIMLHKSLVCVLHADIISICNICRRNKANNNTSGKSLYIRTFDREIMVSL